MKKTIAYNSHQQPSISLVYYSFFFFLCSFFFSRDASSSHSFSISIHAYGSMLTAFIPQKCNIHFILSFRRSSNTETLTHKNISQKLHNLIFIFRQQFLYSLDTQIHLSMDTIFKKQKKKLTCLHIDSEVLQKKCKKGMMKKKIQNGLKGKKHRKCLQNFFSFCIQYILMLSCYSLRFRFCFYSFLSLLNFNAYTIYDFLVYGKKK